MLSKTESNLHRGMWNHLTFLLVIIVLTFSAYSNVIHGEPQFDDGEFVFENPLIQSLEAFKDINLWDAFKSGVRPVTAFTFALNYYLWGKDTFSYHLTNLVIHIVNGVLVYLFIYITVTLPSKSPLIPLLQRGKPYSPLWQRGVRGDFVRERWIAFLTALLFSIHPIQTESVSYIYQRAESLSSMFYLASLIAFIAAARYGRAANILYLVFITGFVVALGSKEIAVTLPVTAFLYGVYFFEKKEVWKKLAAPAILIFIGLIVAAVRIVSIGENPVAGYDIKEFTPREYLITQLGVIMNYLRLVILPVGQNMDHGYIISRSFLEVKTLISFAFLLILISLGIMLYKRWRAGSFFILWFFILLLPSSSIVPLKDVLVEHRLYLPALGIFFIIASGVVFLADLLRERLNKRWFIIINLSLFIFISSVLWLATYKRNSLWNSRIAMWEDVVKKSPRNARGHYNLGNAYSAEGYIDKALEQFQTAVRLDPLYIIAYNNLGNCYLLKGDYKNAIRGYIESLTIEPRNVEAYYNIGLSFESLGIFDTAKDFFIVFVRYPPPKIYTKKVNELTQKYGITENTPIPDISLLIQRAKNVYGQVE